MDKSGPAQLREWMHRRRFLQKEAAEHIGFDEAVISHFLGGTRTPSLENAVKIERATGIPVEAWVSSANGSAVTSAPRRAKRAS